MKQLKVIAGFIVLLVITIAGIGWMNTYFANMYAKKTVENDPCLITVKKGDSKTVLDARLFKNFKKTDDSNKFFTVMIDDNDNVAVTFAQFEGDEKIASKAFIAWSECSGK